MGLAADCTADEVALAVEAAARAQPAWWRVPGVEKAKLLREAAQRIRAQEHELSRLMARETGKPLIDINPWAWSGDHSMAKDLIPGCLFASVPMHGSAPDILDLPVTILDYFGIEKPQQMVGRSLLRAGREASS